MSRRVGTSTRPTRRPVVVIAGEDSNDRKVLRLILEQTCPELAGRLVEIKDNVRLRDATGATLKHRVDILRRKALARAEREGVALACLFVHEDWDAVDSDAAERAWNRVQESIERSAGFGHYVLAVWEVEAWLLRFPRAVTATVSTWKVPNKFRGADTGLVHDPKRAFRAEVSLGGRRYEEADAISVIEHAVSVGELHAPVGTNRSWEWFRTHASRCCASHLRG